jgi:hypothetical protein
LPDQKTHLGVVVFFQWEFGDSRPVLIHNGHLPIRKTEREHAARPELFGNLPSALAGRLHIREIKARSETTVVLFKNSTWNFGMPKGQRGRSN